VETQQIKIPGVYDQPAYLGLLNYQWYSSYKIEQSVLLDAGASCRTYKISARSVPRLCIVDGLQFDGSRLRASRGAVYRDRWMAKRQLAILTGLSGNTTAKTNKSAQEKVLSDFFCISFF
jgi:hypothetical protein